jgi:hypothetical protein
MVERLGRIADSDERRLLKESGNICGRPRFIWENLDFPENFSRWHTVCSLRYAKGIRQPQRRREIEMFGYGKILVTMAVWTLIMFPSFTVMASADDPGDDAVAEGSGNTYQHRNAWNHRNVTQNSYGDKGENPGSGQGRGFVDEDGDGVNDLAPDHDGDGIPNGKDPDWVKNKRDGTGAQAGGSLSQGSKRCVRSQNRGNKGSQ